MGPEPGMQGYTTINHAFGSIVLSDDYIRNSCISSNEDVETIREAIFENLRKGPTGENQPHNVVVLYFNRLEGYFNIDKGF